MTVKEFWDSEELLAIHCDTEEKAIRLLKKFDKLGKKWSSSESYLDVNDWYINKKDTCYDNKGCYGTVCFLKAQGFLIIEFDDLKNFKESKSFTKKDLKNRMVVETRNGKRYLVVDDCLIGVNGYFNINDYSNYLLYDCDSEWDIVKVFKQLIHFGCGFEKHLYYDEFNDLIWQRKELLTKEEKEYLSVVFKPVKNDVKCIIKHKIFTSEWIQIVLIDGDISLYFFEKDTQFKGLEVDKEYTLKDLGLE